MNVFTRPAVPKFFNTAGPGIPGDHYMIDPLRRIDYENVSAMIDQKRYFVMHAPRGIKAVLACLKDGVERYVGDTLVSVLRQLRAGYTDRPENFPISVILCGVRDVRDHRINTSGGDVITGGSCFNIKAESLRLGDFSYDEIRELYLQHTEATGQVFEEDVYPRVWELTRGQPWLVNALAHEATWRMKDARNRSVPITLTRIDQAAENLVLERATHIDQLIYRLNDERVKRVLASMLAGEDWPEQDRPSIDDIQYVLDLGLIRKDEDTRNFVISNGIYREVIPRELTSVTQDNMAARVTPQWYDTPDGGIDMSKLLREFQQFFRENIESWREQNILLELKTVRAKRSLNRVLREGLEQTAAYAERAGADEAHLVICDERPGISWDEKIYDRVEHGIHVWGM
ncbi:MAG: hypothetical protein LBR38_01650 [Synergistaceae bacterium]|nr:hypothetical protein [Synergistaceae bacterium]